MELSGKIARRNLQTKSLRLLVLGSCIGLTAITSNYTLLTAEQARFFSAAAILILFIATLLAAYSYLKRYDREFAVLHPNIQLPNSMVSGGLDSSQEPIEFWLLNTAPQHNIVLTTQKRLLQIDKAGLSDEQWQKIVSAFPPDKRGSSRTIRSSVNLSIILYAAFCLAAHSFLQSPTNVEAFNFLAHGAYNPTLIFQGEYYRLLSYSWLHTNLVHLGMNVLALILIAQAIGRNFPVTSILSVIVITAIGSSVVGSLVQGFNIIVGASGAVMGLFGFLFAAQGNRDQRLHHLSRIAGQKVLYAILLLEIVLAWRYSWYGGTIHVSGFLAGYLWYRHTSNAAKSGQWQNGRTPVHIFTCGMGALLLINWSAHTFDYVRQPKNLVESTVNQAIPLLKITGSTALPDLTDATQEEVVSMRNIALKKMGRESLFAWPVARADYWLGDLQAATDRLRSLTTDHPDRTQLQELWLSVEADLAKTKVSDNPLRELPAGPGTAYLATMALDRFARINLGRHAVPIEKALRSKAKIEWVLVEITEPLDKPKPGTYGVWPIPKKKFRTSATANFVEGKSR